MLASRQECQERQERQERQEGRCVDPSSERVEPTRFGALTGESNTHCQLGNQLDMTNSLCRVECSSEARALSEAAISRVSLPLGHAEGTARIEPALSAWELTVSRGTRQDG